MAGKVDTAEAHVPSGDPWWDGLQLEIKCGGRVYRRDGAAVMVCKVAWALCEAVFALGVALV